MGLGLNITALCVLSVWSSVGSSTCYRPFVIGVMLISCSIGKGEINMHKVPHGLCHLSLSEGNLFRRSIYKIKLPVSTESGSILSWHG